jgi:hypothetical protein
MPNLWITVDADLGLLAIITWPFFCSSYSDSTTIVTEMHV